MICDLAYYVGFYVFLTVTLVKAFGEEFIKNGFCFFLLLACAFIITAGVLIIAEKNGPDDYNE